MKLHPKVKTICEEFAIRYEWIAGDESLFISVSPHFVDIVKQRLKNSPFELVSTKEREKCYNSSLDINSGKITHTTLPATTTLWYRIPEEEEKSYDFDDEEDE